MKLRADREMTQEGGYGADIKLNTRYNSSRVFWSPRGNSYVVMERDGWGRWEPIQRPTIASINGIGEIRWTIDPANPAFALDSEATLAVGYFFE
jgi:hypothetical protein